MTDRLMLYHGSDALFENVDLSKSKDKRDFGRGFYTTTIPSQAESWALSMRTRRSSPTAFVYEFELEVTDEMKVQIFEGLTLPWLDFVKENRLVGGTQHDYDIVMGPVANDNTLTTVTRYMRGIYDADEAIRRLRYFKVNDQVSLHTEKAIAQLTLTRRYEVG